VRIRGENGVYLLSEDEFLEALDRENQGVSDSIIEEKDVGVNPYLECPKCGSSLIDQEHFDRAVNMKVYHCVRCGVWYFESGEIDENGTDNDDVWDAS